MRLESGDLLPTYTDGISEAMTVENEEWGEERMLAAVSKVRRGAAA
jgi:sigma-B regulation protein RsbU (phosphoserine phosphatase)